MAIIIEPVVTEEKLRSLLAEGHEQSGLDYKRTYDLNYTKHLVGIVKDIAAMQAEESGGYIVIGADDYGKVVPDLTAQHAALFDDATVRAKVRGYIAEPFEVRVARHQLDGNNLVLVYVAPHVDGWCIFIRRGHTRTRRQASPRQSSAWARCLSGEAPQASAGSIPTVGAFSDRSSLGGKRSGVRRCVQSWSL